MRRRIVECGLVGIITAAILPSPVCAAESGPSPRISALERLRMDGARKPASDDEDEPETPIKVPSDPALEGRVLLGELNCLSCHAASDELKPFVSTKRAPVLDDLGSRVKVDWLRRYLLDTHAAKSGATMPDVLRDVSPNQKPAVVESLVHYLMDTGRTADIVRDLAAAQRGRELYHTVGCMACHDPQEGDAEPIATSVPLPNLSQKYSSVSLAAFLKETHKWRPSGRMPVFPLNDAQFRDLAHYLVKDVSVEPNVEYAVYHGGWDSIPKFDDLKPDSSGQCGGFDLGVAQRTNDFGVRFRGQWKLEKAGKYRFFLGSDDGARLMIDGRAIVDNDGIHPHQEQSAEANLDAGWHDVVVDYIQGGGEWTLAVDIEGNGLLRQPLGSLVTRDRKEPTAGPQSFVVNAPLAEKGRTYFLSQGCAKCHVLHRNGERVTSNTPVTRNLASLDPTQGCLAQTPPGRVPNYHLSPVQRQQLTAAMKSPPVETAAQAIHRNLLTFNCYACHTRDGWGGVEERRNSSFDSLIKEMGDESRLPPTLTGVGDKLRDNWLAYILEHSSDDRKNYMRVKMPKFGASNVGSLAALFVTADRRSEATPAPESSDASYRIKAAGRHLVGGAALSCIKCHDFREHPSTGIRAISLTTMTKRLREEWFYPYMLNPQEFRPGTRMPAPWPNGRASLTDVLQGDTKLQMWAVWNYLADGDQAAIPVGLVREPIELTPSDTPIIYRNFIEGAGNRAICVGYPEKLNLAFDANDFRLALIWHGQFLDASQHWTGRGAGTIGPLGDNVLNLGPHPQFAILASNADSWPTTSGRDAGFKFLGYVLDQQQRPTFRYRLGKITIEDTPKPLIQLGDTYPALERTLKLSGAVPAGALWYRAAVAKSIDDVGDNTFRIDGLWTIRLQAAEKAMLRESNDRKELLIPLTFRNEKTQIVQTYDW